MDPGLHRPAARPLGDTPEVAEKVKAIDSSPRLDNPISLKDLLPERPYHSSSNFLREQEAYYKGSTASAPSSSRSTTRSCIVGGIGPIVDLANNQRVHDLILAFYRADKPIAAECYGVTASPSRATRRTARASSRASTSPATAWSTTTRTAPGFMGTDFNMGPPPYPLEYILRDATARTAGTTATSARRRP